MRAKRFISVILSILIVCSSFAGLTAFADESNKNERTIEVASVGADVNVPGVSATSGATGDCTWTFNEKTKTLTVSGNGEMGNFDFLWEDFCNEIHNIVIEQGVTSIGISAFKNCTNLTNVTISDSVTSIKNEAFSNCTSLTNIEIPKSVTSIGWNGFSNCKSLNNINLPNSITSIGWYAFSNCTNINNIKIPNSVTNIGCYLFYNCTSLTSISIPNSITSIGACAFSGCTSLTRITIPDSVTIIEEYVFTDCTSLTSITIPLKVESIGYCALGYYTDENWNHEKVKDFSIYGYKGTTAEKYSKENGIKFVDLCAAKTSQKVTGVKSQYFTSAGKSFILKPKAKTKLTYTSSNKNVAVVSSTGKVTVKAGGYAYITVKASENGNYKSAYVKTKIISAPKDFTSKDISKVKKTGKTTAKITWKSLAGATGYTVQLATNKSYKGAKTVKNSKNTANLTGLKKGKTYYVRINAYTKVSGKNYSNKWYTVKFKM